MIVAPQGPIPVRLARGDRPRPTEFGVRRGFPVPRKPDSGAGASSPAGLKLLFEHSAQAHRTS
jgi:hypothetical protein